MAYSLFLEERFRLRVLAPRLGEQRVRGVIDRADVTPRHATSRKLETPFDRAMHIRLRPPPVLIAAICVAAAVALSLLH
jgi:hypothetical protein